MNRDLATAVAKTTRDQAVHDAREDLWELRRRAVEAGRDRSRKIAKTTRIDTRTGELRYNPAGRLLRDWYFHVYLNTLRRDLGEPAITIDAQQVETNARILKELRNADGLAALKVVALIRDTAVDDAAHAAAGVVDHLAGVAVRRAILHVAEDRFGGDELAIHVTRHWYQHCYGDHVFGAVRCRHPLAEVTDAQEREVARTLRTGEARRLIGTDGVPLVTAQGTMLSAHDRALARGLAGLVSPITDADHHTDTELPLSKRVTRTWSDLDDGERAQWLRAVGANRVPPTTSWHELSGDTQTKIIQLYLATHQPDSVARPFAGEVINEVASEAAMRMFNHCGALEAGAAGDQNAVDSDMYRGDDLTMSTEARQQGVGLST